MTRTNAARLANARRKMLDALHLRFGDVTASDLGRTRPAVQNVWPPGLRTLPAERLNRLHFQNAARTVISANTPSFTPLCVTATPTTGCRARSWRRGDTVAITAASLVVAFPTSIGLVELTALAEQGHPNHSFGNSTFFLVGAKVNELMLLDFDISRIIRRALIGSMHRLVLYFGCVDGIVAGFAQPPARETFAAVRCQRSPNREGDCGIK